VEVVSAGLVDDVDSAGARATFSQRERRSDLLLGDHLRAVCLCASCCTARQSPYVLAGLQPTPAMDIATVTMFDH